MSTNTTVKVLVAGDIEGQFNKFVRRLKSVNEKNGPFDVLFCVGDFFGSDDNSQWDQFKNGENNFPITTYVLGPTNTLDVKYYKCDDDSSLCENVFYLGKRGHFKDAAGLSVAYLSGTEGVESDEVHFSRKDVDTLIATISDSSNFNGVDLLLTSSWPTGVEKYSNIKCSLDAQASHSMMIAELAVNLMPKYHISALNGIFYEREPYRNHIVLAESLKTPTRFLGLANVLSKQKYLYALNLTPITKMERKDLIVQPENITECPYKMQKSKQSSSSEAGGGMQYFYNTDNAQSTERKPPKRDRDGNFQPKQHNQECWFCLKSAKVEKHLIVDIGTSAYLAFAKGPLSENHVLIIPVEHIQSYVMCDENLQKEIRQLKAALTKFFLSQHMVTVFFERNYKSAHLQIQCIPVPIKTKPILREVFLDYAKLHDISLTELPQDTVLSEIVEQGRPYFHVELPSGDRLFSGIGRVSGKSKQDSFPLQFGREVLADPQILDSQHKIDWRACSMDIDAETNMTTTFRKGFEPFNES